MAQSNPVASTEHLLDEAWAALDAMPEKPEPTDADAVVRPLIEAEIATFGSIQTESMDAWEPRVEILTELSARFPIKRRGHAGLRKRREAQERWSVLSGVIAPKEKSEKQSTDLASVHEVASKKEVNSDFAQKRLSGAQFTILMDLPEVTQQFVYFTKPVALEEARTTVKTWKNASKIPSERQVCALLAGMHRANEEPHKIKEITKSIKSKWDQFELRRLDNLAAVAACIIDESAYRAPKNVYPVVNLANFEDIWRHGEAALLKANGEKPFLFTYQDDYCVIHNGQRVMLSERDLTVFLNTHSKWINSTSAGDKQVIREVSVPKDAAQHIFNRRYKPVPELAAIRSAPFFAKDGRLVDQEGYDAETETSLRLGGLEIPGVSREPSSQDVEASLQLIFGETFADFPLDGVEITGVSPSRAHLLAMILQPFVRDLIDGVTPIYAVTKPMPGTGGGLLVELASMISGGVPAAAQPMPNSEEELTKTITAIANAGSEWCFFDNMNVAAASGAFASAITAPTYKARLLGSSRMVEAPLRHVWVMVANNIKGSPEILRRCVMIELDAQLARPEMRTEWHHADIRGWVSKNRGRLVWACLTLVQNWVAKGKEPYTGVLLGSFENWSRVMGGILRDAEIAGFLGNTERLRSYAATDDVSGVQTLIDALSEYPDGTAFRAGGDAPIKGQSLWTCRGLMPLL